MSKRNRIVYWISTAWMALGMLSTGLVQLFKVPSGIQPILNLGYPEYFLTILGVWKILGVIALLIPKLPLVKEWVYAGFFFTMAGAIFSHLLAGNSLQEIAPPLLLLVLTVVSWYFRPVDRKVIAVNY